MVVVAGGMFGLRNEQVVRAVFAAATLLLLVVCQTAEGLAPNTNVTACSGGLTLSPEEGRTLAQHPFLDFIYFTTANVLNTTDTLFAFEYVGVNQYSLVSTLVLPLPYYWTTHLLVSPDGLDLSLTSWNGLNASSSYMLRDLLSSGVPQSNLTLEDVSGYEPQIFTSASVSPDFTFFFEISGGSILTFSRSTVDGSRIPTLSVLLDANTTLDANVWCDSNIVLVGSISPGGVVNRYNRTASSLYLESSISVGSGEITKKLVTSPLNGTSYIVTALIQRTPSYYYLWSLEIPKDIGVIAPIATYDCYWIGVCETATDMVVSPDNVYLYVLTTTGIVKYLYNNGVPDSPALIYTPGGVAMQVSHDGLFFHVLDTSLYNILNRDPFSGNVTCWSPSISVTITATPSRTPSHTLTRTVTPTMTPTKTKTPTISETPTRTPTVSIPVAATSILVESSSVFPSNSEKETPTPTPTPTEKCDFICNDVCVVSADECAKQSSPDSDIEKIDINSDEVRISTKAADTLGKDAEVAPIKVKIKSNKDVEVPVVGSGEDKTAVQYGSVNIPKNTFPKGWTISITPAYNDSLKKAKEQEKDDCGDSESSKSSVTSIAFNLDVYDENGKKQKVENLPKGIDFDIIVTLPESLADEAEKLDFSFINDGADVWKSLGKTTVTPLKSSKPIKSPDGEKLALFRVQSSTSHFTSFAVLLGSTSNGSSGCGSNRTLWIVSVSLLATAIVMTFVLGFFLPKLAFFRVAVYGYDKKAEMKKFTKMRRRVGDVEDIEN
eukprot:TRINITY_DN9859_c0_g1_i1.p1 TRINITY_DN9859_c0_g1~~TRINITY_DN9859_c0_g1_i1.p1  ORF type:complete len:784 (+),score=131.83 TRINITY_DN9859_c0_g1_i1:22-2352(+)